MLGYLGVVGKGVEEVLSHEGGSLGEGGGQVVVAGPHNYPFRREQQHGAGLGVEDGQQIERGHQDGEIEAGE